MGDGRLLILSRVILKTLHTLELESWPLHQQTSRYKQRFLLIVAKYPKDHTVKGVKVMIRSLGKNRCFPTVQPVRTVVLIVS